MTLLIISFIEDKLRFEFRQTNAFYNSYIEVLSINTTFSLTWLREIWLFDFFKYSIERYIEVNPSRKNLLVYTKTKDTGFEPNC